MPFFWTHPLVPLNFKFSWSENVVDDESSSATFAGWKTFSMNNPQAGCYLSWLENLFNCKSSSCLQSQVFGKPFRRRVLQLVATLAGLKTFRRVLELVAKLAGWKTFSTTSPRAGCNLRWLENHFDDVSSS